jgi:hypothetical protein
MMIIVKFVQALVEDIINMNRLEANTEILEKLWIAVSEYPDLRFGQILVMLKIVREDNETMRGGWEDEFYLESKDLLERISK